MLARNFIIVCTVVAVFAILFSKLVNNQHRYAGVTRLDENFWLH